MKKHSILLFLILAAGCSTAQSYFPFIEFGKTWADLDRFDNTGSPIYLWTTNYKFSEDTIQYQGKTYYSLLSSFNDSTMLNWEQEDTHYREDSNKVFALSLWGEESVLYDFNLNEGDSIIVSEWINYAYVSHVDSLSICGSYRKAIYLNCYPWNEPIDIWIEGIGSLYSTFNPLNFFFLSDNTYELICASDSSCQLYQNPKYSSCFVSDTFYQASTSNITTCNLFNVYPNPFSESCLVTINEQQINEVTVLLFNSQGQVVSTEHAISTPFIFYRKDLPSGSYFMKLICKDQVLLKKVIII
jgi:hypothetical protein